MFLKVYKFKILMAMLLVPFLAFAQPPSGWEIPTPLSFQTHNIIVPDGISLEVNGIAVENGDWLGVFYLEGGSFVCGGHVQMGDPNTPNNNITAYGNVGGAFDGFSMGEAFTWKFYDSSEDMEYFTQAEYAEGPGAGYFTAGASTLQGFTQAFVISASADPSTISMAGDVDLEAENLDPVNYNVVDWVWDDGNGNTYPGQNVTVYVDQTTTFTVTATTDASLTATASVTVTMSTVFAGADAEVCKVPGTYELADAVVAGDFFSYFWSTAGDGAFDNPNAMNPTYTAGANDLANGTVTLTLTAVGINGPVTSDITLTYAEPATVDIIPDDIYLCATANTILDVADFTGLVEAANYANLQWTAINGAGTFSSEVVPEPTYFPSLIDLAQFDNDGTPTILQIQVDSEDPCTIDDEDQVNLRYVRAPEVVDAGAEAGYCIEPGLMSHTFADAQVVFGNNPWVPEAINSIMWTTDGTGTFDDPTIANPTYFFGPGEMVTGTINFTLTAETEQACGPVTSETSITLQAPPEAYAGPDATICEDQIYEFTESYANNYDLIQWSGINGTGDFSDENIAQPTYTPSFQDILQGCVTLQIEASAIDPCVGGASDQMELCFQLNPVVIAGEDATICANETYTTDPTVENSNGPFMWTQVGGAGQLLNADQLNATYVAANPDDVGNTVYLTLTAEPISPCTVAGESTMELYIECAPNVYAGEDFTVCETENPELVGEASCVSQTMWATTGDGYFCCPDDLTTTYYPGPMDKEGCVTLVLIGYPEAPCSLYELDKVVVCFDPAPMVDAGPDMTVCEGESIQINGTAMDVCGLQWFVFNGNGTFDDETITDPVYTPNGQDLIAGTVQLIITGAPCGTCTEPAMDTMNLTIQPLPVVEIEENEATICEDQMLNTCDLTLNVENETSVAWTSQGDGAFADPAMLCTTYTPGMDDIANGLTVLTLTAAPTDPCTASASDDVILNIQLLPYVNIIPEDTTICESDVFDFTNLVEASNYAAIQWTNINGSGSFVPGETVLQPTYEPGFIDLQQGFVELSINVSPVGPCVGNGMTDFITIYFQKEVAIDIPQSAIICEDATWTPDPYSIENNCGVMWATTGDGTFDDATAEYPVYTPGPNDITNEGVELTLTGVGCSTCSDVTVSVFLMIQMNPTADAGEDGVVCEQLCSPPWTNGIYEGLNGAVTYASSFVWSTDGDGQFIPSNDVLDPAYVLGDGDVADPDMEVELCLTAMPMDPCTVSATDCMILSIQPFPVANAGDDVSICEGGNAQLDGSTEYATGVFWDFALYGEGDGSWSSQIIEDPVYTPGPEDIERGYVELIMVAFPMSPCTYPDADNMTVFIIPEPVANAGEDLTICEGETAQLNGSVENASGGFEWTTNGDGAFDPGTGVLDPVYVPGPNDIAAGSVELCLYAYDGTACQADYHDCLTLNILPPPVVNAGPDGTVCEDGTFCLDDATESNTSSVMWATSGDGSFDDPMALNACYMPGPTDIENEMATLTLTGYPLDPCSIEVTDDMVLTIQVLPEVTFDPNEGEICAYETFTAMPTIVSDYDYTIMWTSDGMGSFDDATIENPTYTPGPGDAGNVVTLTLTVTPGEFCATPVSADFYLTVNEEPAVLFCFNGEEASTGSVFTYCYDETVTVTLCNVLAGTGPFDIDWTVNGDPFSASGVALDGVLFEDMLDAGTYDIAITSITDANGCSVQDVSVYNAQVVVNPEPDANFCVNGVVAGYGDTFEFCYDQTVVVDMCEILSGTGPFDLEWTVDGDPYSADGVAEGGELFNGMLEVGTHEVVLTSLTDANGCVLSNPSQYAMTIVINPEPFITFAVNGNQVAPGYYEEFCFDENIEISLYDIWSGTAPFEVCYTVTKDGDPFMDDCVTVENPGDILASQVLDPGTYELSVTSLTDANGCVASANTLAQYTGTIVVNPEPVASFCFNGDVAATGSVFDYCYDEEVVVTLCDIVQGTGPFEVCWTVNNGPEECATLDAGGVLFQGMLDPGTYDVQVTSIVDANGCAASDVTPYMATAVVHPEPDANLCVNGDVVGYNDTFTFCYNENIDVTLCEILAGDGPFEICWSLDNGPEECMTVAEGESLFSGTLPVGEHIVQLTSMTDANGCMLADPTPYVMNFVINPEPAVLFCFNGNEASTGSVFEYCYDEEVVVTLCEDVMGTGPFDIEWTVNGDAFSATDVNVGDVLFQGLLDPDTYVVEITSLTDANGCVVSDPSIYTATAIVHPEPFITFAVNGNQVAPGYMEEFCYDETITVSMFDIWSGTAPFEVCYTVTKDGDPFMEDCVTVENPGDILASQMLDPGTYVLSVTSLTDANGCMASQATLEQYTGTIIVNEEPDVNICVNQEVVGYNDSFTFCYDDVIDVTLCEALAGEGPFEVCWSLDGAPEECMTVNVGDALYNGTLPVGTHTVQLTSLTDANGCMLADPSNYGFTVTVNPEPMALFCFNGQEASTGSVFNFCETTTVDVTLCQIVAGAGPFEVCYTVNNGPEECVTVAEGESLFTDMLDPGSYDIAIVSIMDANGCSAGDVSIYQATVNIQAAPMVNAGDDMETCEEAPIMLTGSAENYSSVMWSGGLGTFDPMDDVATTYTPAAGETGVVELCLTAMPIDPCTVEAVDCMELTIVPAPTVDAGADISECNNVVSVPLSATVANYSTLEWQVDPLLGFIDTPTEPNANFYPSPEALANGAEICIEVMPINPPCELPVEDCLNVTFIPSPQAFAGNDATICEGNTEFVLGDAFANNYDALMWTTSGDGTFDDETALNPTYYPGMDDIANGGAELCIEAMPLAGCNTSAVACLNLTIIPDPVIEPADPIELDCEYYDFQDLVWLPIPLNPVVTGGETFQWSTSGDGVFGDPTAQNTTYQLGPEMDKWNGIVTLTLTVQGAGNCGVEASMDFIIYVPQQIIEIEPGTAWRGISSYVAKETTSVAEVMDPVVLIPGSQSLVIMIDKQGTSFWPEPIPPINNLGNWAPIGYQAKFKDQGCLPIYGDEPYDTTGHTFMIDGSFTYLPVLTNQKVALNEFFADHLNDILLIYDWYTGDLWTPGPEVDPLDTIRPGFAYLMVNKLGFTPYEITFPDIDINGNIVSAPGQPVATTDNSGPWNEVVNTSQPHFILFADEVMSKVQPGDIFGAFNQYNECVGVAEYNNRDEMFRLLAMGDDPVSEEVEGFEAGEYMNFKLYRPSTGETFDVAFTYDPEYPSYDNQFAVYGVSKVVDMTMNATSVGTGLTSNSISVYPNPASDMINITSDYDIKSVTLINYVGQVVYTSDVNSYDFQINVSSYVTGMYMLNIETTDGNVITKRITVE